MTVQQAFELAFQHHQSGRLAEAEAIYRQILAVEPRHADSLHLLGVIAHQVGRHDVAVDLIRQAIVLVPGIPDFHSNLGEAYRAQGQWDEAIASFRQAIALKPDFVEAHSNLGTAFKGKGHLNEAVAAYRLAIALNPDFVEVYNNLGTVLKDKGQLDEAIAAYRQAIALQPSFPEAHYNLASALNDKGQLDEAIASYRQALALKPSFSEAHYNLANALKDKGQLDEAIAAYRQALALKPSFSEVRYNLANALKDKGQLDEAAATYRQAIAIKPAFAEAYSNLGTVLRDQGQLDEAIAAFRQAITFQPDNAEIHSNLVLTLNWHPGCDARAIAEEHRHWNRQHAEPLRQCLQPHSNDRNSERRLRIGYVSPDFREHAVGRFLRPLLAQHDRRGFEIFCYAQVPTPDAMTRQLQTHADQWHNLVGLSDEQSAELIRGHQIDILVDLALHAAQNRLLIFARKPAPVQVTYLAYAGTSGLNTMDYRLSDPFLDPPGADESVYSERTIRLAQTYWCYQPVHTPPIGPAPVLESGHVTFGCLNNFCKVNEPTLETWMRLLRAVQSAHLLLHAPEGSHRQRTADLFRRSGIDPRQLRFVGKAPLSEYLQLYGQIDIALDPFPYGGGTTTCDALWMGVPVISRKGNTAVGRAGLSLLSNIGLHELVAQTPEEYVRIAAGLARDLPRLSHLRSTLRQRMEQSPLMDAPRFARNIETAYRTMWRQWCMEKEPSPP